MSPRRRTVLTALGSLGLAGGGMAYWQRHRIRRRNGVADLDSTLAIDVPAIEEPLHSTDDHVHASYSRAREHVAETDALLEAEQSVAETHRDRADESLDANPPEAATDDRNRLSALHSYRLAVENSGRARAWPHHDDTDGEPSAALKQAHAVLESALESFEHTYRDESLTRLVVQAGEADSLRSRAASRLSHASYFIDDEERTNIAAWGATEIGRQRLFDAERFLEEQRGPDRVADLEAAYARLVEQTEHKEEQVDWEYASEVRSHAAARWRDTMLRSTQPDDHFEAGRLGLATRDQAERTLVALSLDAFENIPQRRGLSDTEFDAFADIDGLQGVKQEAVDAIRCTHETTGTDPLARHLLTDAITRIERADRQAERLRSDVRSVSDEEWRTGRYNLYLRYREAALDARNIEQVVQDVSDGAIS